MDASILSRRVVTHLPLIVIWLCCLPVLWWTLISPSHVFVEVGAWGDHAYLQGINLPEESSSENYRWTTGTSQLTLPTIGAQFRLLQFRAHGWRPAGQTSPTLYLGNAAHEPAAVAMRPEMRIYRVLLPPTDHWQTQLDLQSSAYQPPGDQRMIGVAFDWIELVAVGQAVINWWQWSGQVGLLLLLLLGIALLRLPLLVQTMAAALVASGQIWANLSEPLWVSAALGGWLVLAALVLLVVLWLRWYTPQTFDPVIVALLLFGLMVRLAGAIHPLFNSHDVDVHMRWLDTVIGGQWYLYSTPSEARGREIFNPPAAYALLAPLELLLPSSRLVVQVGVALADSLSALLVVLIARQVGLSLMAIRWSLLLFLGLPINLTIVWWGFSTNVIAQTLGLLLIWLLLRLLHHPNRGLLALTTVVALVALMTHIGALLLMMALFGILTLLAIWQRAVMPGWKYAIVTLSVTVLLAVPLYFTAAATPLLDPDDQTTILAGSGALTLSPGWKIAERFWFLGQAAPRAYTLVMVLLALPGLLLLLLQGRTTLRLLVSAWLAATLLLLLVHMGTGMLTRYLYFVAPLLCLAVGVVLARLSYRTLGRWLAYGMATWMLWLGTSLWLQGVLLRVKPSALPLSH